MPNVTPVFRRRLALAVWAAALLLFLLMGVWNVNADRQEAENRLSSEAGRTAAQLAALLSLPAWELDELAARTIVMAAMADESIYAVKVQTNKGLLEGQRRNYQWEPVPWDDEIAENSVQGMPAAAPWGLAAARRWTRRVAWPQGRGLLWCRPPPPPMRPQAIRP